MRNRVSVTTKPSTESPRNSSRSLVGRPPFSYANERWVRACVNNASSRLTPIAVHRSCSCTDANCPPAVAADAGLRAIWTIPRSEILDLAALVFQVQGGAGGVGNDPRLVRPRIRGHTA